MPVFPIVGPVDSAGRFDLSESDLRHLRKVLRLQAGDLFSVQLSDGRRGEAQLETQGKKRLGKIVSLREALPEQRLPLWLGIGVLRWERLEWLVEKAVELGMERLFPLQLSQGRLGKSDIISANKIKRLDKIAQETLKQCERITSTRIEAPTDLRKFLRLVQDSAPADSKKMILQERIAEPLLHAKLSPSDRHFILLLGPEGGWTEEESSSAKAAGFAPVSLGPLLLRSETAALYAASALDFHLSRHRRAS